MGEDKKGWETSCSMVMPIHRFYPEESSAIWNGVRVIMTIGQGFAPSGAVIKNSVRANKI